MAIFSTNQNRHLYVAKAYNATVNDDSAIGTIGGVKTIGEGNEKELSFKYRGADGSMKSDRIQVRNLDYAKAFKAADMVTPLKSYKVVLDTDVNGGTLVAGQDYVLRIEFRQWIGGSDIDTYIKDGVVHVTSGMVTAPKKFFDAMEESLNLGFSREIGASKTSNPYLKFESTTDGIVITEKEQEWHQGNKVQQVLFTVQPTTIYVDGEDAVWGKVEDKTPAKADAVVGTTGIGNGKQIAALEWFCMGERGDQYRMIGYPNVVYTKYLVDPTKEYNVLEIHHAFRDEGVNSYRSEKDITIVAEDASVIDSIIGAINDAAGTEIATLGD